MKYTYEFKRQVIDDYLAGRGGVLALSKRYGIPGKSLLHQWITAYRKFGDDGLKTSWTREVYDAEFKQKAVEMYLAGLDSYEGAAAKLHIRNPATLNRWVKEYQEHGVSAWEVRPRGRPRKSAVFPETLPEPEKSQALEVTMMPKKLEDASVFIAMACSGRHVSVRNWKLPPDVYPVLGGAALAPRRPPEMSYDDFGKNISKEHPLYAELTVTYWLHKNAPKVDYLGVCDEHRCFLVTGGFRKALMAQNVDVILPHARIQLPNIEAYFNPMVTGALQRRDYERMLELLDTKEPAMAACARRLFQQEFGLPSNLLIARKDVFHDYAAFLFLMLEAVHQRNKADKIQQEPRSLAALGELLTSVYFAYHKELKIQHAHTHLMA